MAMSNFLRGELYDHVLRNSAYVPPANIFAALWKGDPTASGAGGAEVAGGAYARAAVTMGDDAGGLGIGENSAQVVFPTATADWATDLNKVTHIALFDANAAGNMLLFGPLNQATTILTGETPKILVGNLDALFQ
jgi:hypothetical protein